MDKVEKKEATDEVLDSMSTDVDSFYALVEEVGNISTIDAAKRLNYPTKLVEIYADILAKHGKLRIVYPLFSQPVCYSISYLLTHEDGMTKLKKFFKNVLKPGKKPVLKRFLAPAPAAPTTATQGNPLVHDIAPAPAFSAAQVLGNPASVVSEPVTPESLPVQKADVHEVPGTSMDDKFIVGEKSHSTFEEKTHEAVVLSVAELHEDESEDALSRLDNALGGGKDAMAVQEQPMKVTEGAAAGKKIESSMIDPTPVQADFPADDQDDMAKSDALFSKQPDVDTLKSDKKRVSGHKQKQVAPVVVDTDKAPEHPKSRGHAADPKASKTVKPVQDATKPFMATRTKTVVKGSSTTIVQPRMKKKPGPIMSVKPPHDLKMQSKTKLTAQPKAVASTPKGKTSSVKKPAPVKSPAKKKISTHQLISKKRNESRMLKKVVSKAAKKSKNARR